MFYKAMLALLTLHLGMVGYAQIPCTTSLRGQILDADGALLFGAAILVMPGDRGQTIGPDGGYAFDGLCPGTYTITVQYIGYQATSVVIKLDGDVRRDFVLEEEVRELKEVIIHHHDAAHTEHATNFSEIDERKLGEYAGRTLGETLREIPGVTTLQSGPGVFKPVIHGLHSQRLLILNNGLRHEGQQWGAEHAPEIDPFVASNMVVIKDASAIKYGTDALGGVVVVNPAPLPESNALGGSVASVLQSNGRSGAISGMLEGGIENGKGWGWRIQGTAKRGGDFSAADYTLTNTGVRELAFSAAAGYHSKRLGLDLFFSRFMTTNGILRGTVIGNMEDLVHAMEREVPLYTSDFSYDIRAPRQNVSHNLLKVNGHINGQSGEWRFQYGFQRNDREEYDLRIGDLSSRPSIDLELYTHSVDAEWETHHSEVRTFAIGISTLFQSNRNIAGTQRIPFIPNFQNFSGGLFATSKFFLDRWTLDAGARFDYRDYSIKGFDFSNSPYSAAIDFGNISATLGVMHAISDPAAVKLSISTAWRPPHVSELYSIGTHQSAAAIEYGLMLNRSTNEVMEAGEMSLRPEQSLKTVAGIEFTKENVHWEISPFVNYIFNYIYLRPEGITRNVSGVYPYFRYNRADALFVGVDLSATARIGSHLETGAKASLLSARDVVNDNFFLFVPTSRYALDFRYHFGDLGVLGNAYIHAGGQYFARQRLAPRVVTVQELYEAREAGIDLFESDASIFDFTEAPDGYFLLAGAMGFSIKGERTQYDVRLSIDNALNRSYREYTNRFRYFADDLGRNVLLSVKCIF